MVEFLTLISSRPTVEAVCFYSERYFVVDSNFPFNAFFLLTPTTLTILKIKTKFGTDTRTSSPLGVRSTTCLKNNSVCNMFVSSTQKNVISDQDVFGIFLSGI